MRVLIAVDDPALESILERHVHALGLDTDVVDPAVFAPPPGLPDSHGAVFLGGASLEPRHFEVAHDITRERRDGLPVVILVTRRPATEDDFEQGERIRVDGWIEPPCTLQRIAAALREAEEALARRERASSDSPSLLEAVRKEISGLPPQVALEVIRSFTSDTGSMVAEVRSAAERGDLARLRFVAHKIAGASASLGARALSALCRRIEYSPDAEGARLALGLAAEIESSFRAVVKALGETRPRTD